MSKIKVYDEAQPLNQAFDRMVGFHSNLTKNQKKKLAQMISKWVKKLD
jgi:hypothetical protein